MVGIDIQRPVFDAGFWLEAAYSWITRTSVVDDQTTFRLSTGLDYNLFEEYYTFIEYHFNGAGFSEPSDYLLAAQKTAFTKGGTFLLGRHYLIVGSTHTLSPLMGIAGTLFFNLSDGSTLISTSVEYSLSDNWYLDLGAFWGLGSRAVSLPDSQGNPATTLRSEFGYYPDNYFMSIRGYF